MSAILRGRRVGGSQFQVASEVQSRVVITPQGGGGGLGFHGVQHTAGGTCREWRTVCSATVQYTVSGNEAV